MKSVKTSVRCLKIRGSTVLLFTERLQRLLHPGYDAHYILAKFCKNFFSEVRILPEIAKKKRPGRNVRLPHGYPGVTPPGPRSLHFRARRPKPRLPKLARSCARPQAAARPFWLGLLLDQLLLLLRMSNEGLRFAWLIGRGGSWKLNPIAWKSNEL